MTVLEIKKWTLDLGLVQGGAVLFELAGSPISGGGVLSTLKEALYYGGPKLVGPMLYTKTNIFYLFLLTIFGPVYYGPPCWYCSPIVGGDNSLGNRVMLCFHVQRNTERVNNPFRTAVPFWGQTT